MIHRLIVLLVYVCAYVCVCEGKSVCVSSEFLCYMSVHHQITEAVGQTQTFQQGAFN